MIHLRVRGGHAVSFDVLRQQPVSGTRVRVEAVARRYMRCLSVDAKRAIRDQVRAP